MNTIGEKSYVIFLRDFKTDEFYISDDREKQIIQLLNDIAAVEGNPEVTLRSIDERFKGTDDGLLLAMLSSRGYVCSEPLFGYRLGGELSLTMIGHDVYAERAWTLLGEN